MICVVCQNPRREPERPPVCEGDRQRLASILAEIPDLYARLDAARAGSAGGPKVSGSREAPVPVSLDVVDLAAPARIGSVGIRTRGDWSQRGGDPDQVGYLPVATELDSWVRDWRESLYPDHHLPTPTVAILAGWLAARLDRACNEHPAIDEFATAVKRVHRSLERAIGELRQTGERVGCCPAKLRDESRCGTTLRADPYVDRITCRRCGTVWPRAQWLHLAAAQDDVRDEGEVA